MALKNLFDMVKADRYTQTEHGPGKGKPRLLHRSARRH